MGAYYRASLSDFSTDDPARVVGKLSLSTQHQDTKKQQFKAWECEVELLQAASKQLISANASAANWTWLLEYPIPRRHKRLDAVLLAADIIFCFEFKTQDKAYPLQAVRQVEDYALDLRDFHAVSRNRRIVPIVVVPRAKDATNSEQVRTDDNVRPVKLTNAAGFVEVVLSSFEADHCNDAAPIDAAAWDASAYHPVPTIIEAAEALYAGHNVSDIAHSHAGAANLTLTSEKLIQIIQRAQKDSEKIICFVTGIPGAGKTLAGLNVVHNPELRQEGRTAAVFLSGNRPLVKIVSAAITRDHKLRKNTNSADRTVGTFIQNVHTFVRESLEKSNTPPVERVVVFDEAQRAWNADQNRMKNGENRSEPETMLSIMDRHANWAVIVALVGGGQEIHNGEAGLSEWGKTLREKYSTWKIVVSPKALSGDASLSGHSLFGKGDDISSLDIRPEPALHLEVNLRSFRARKLADWVEAVLAGKPDEAVQIANELKEFPLVLTRSLADAKAWLHRHSRGKRRCGLVASSGAMRLRAEGIELSSGFRQGNRDLYVNWFLNHRPDTRSSNQLEVAASEFECQGLELDWVGVCWGGDFSFSASSDGWVHRNLTGSKWGMLKQEIDRRYLSNTYRVLLTRAREGMVLWIPQGDATDLTRPAAWFDDTANYLLRCGVPAI